MRDRTPEIALRAVGAMLAIAAVASLAFVVGSVYVLSAAQSDEIAEKTAAHDVAGHQ